MTAAWADGVLTTIIGVLASILTTLSYVPQLVKACRSGETDDISLRMMVILLAGLALWVLYGIRQADLVIVPANVISCALLIAIIILKLQRD